MQYLFAHDLHPGDSKPSEQEMAAFWELHSCSPKARKFAESLIAGVLAHLEQVDAVVSAASTNFRIDRLADVDRNVLRLGAYELLHSQGLSASIIINEAIEIARKFGSPESGKFVNGVIDRIGREIRPRAAKPGPEQPPATPA